MADTLTPTEVAEALSISGSRYYAFEQRVVASPLAGCEPYLHGLVRSSQQPIAELHREVRRLRQQCDRHLDLAAKHSVKIRSRGGSTGRAASAAEETTLT